MARPAPATLTLPWRGAIERLRARLKARPDTEHEQAIVRVAVGATVGLYLLPSILAGPSEPHIVVWLVYLICSIGQFVAVVMHPCVSPVRRTLGAALDAVTTTWCMVHFEAAAAPMILLYIWSTIGMGFRFGPRELMLSLLLSAAGFGTVLATSEFWREHAAMGAGFMAGLIVLCLYVRKLVRQLFDALSRAEAANQAKRRFISVVSHEMRTPLNAILGMADLLRDTSLSSEQADMLQTLHGSSRVMLGLVEDVLDFSKIEAGKLTLEKTDFDLHALVNSTCRIVAAQAVAKGIDLVVSIMPEVPPAVRGDPHHVRQIIINLVGNAVKFTEQGSVTVHVSAQAETPERVQLKFSIRDTGIGIPPEAQARIFESFTQADQSTARRFGGTGLGTTIAKQLVDLMGGRIGLESAVGLGTTFWFEIALEKQAERAGTGLRELAGARIMLVGFPNGERQPVEQALASWGAVPVVAASIDEARARLAAESNVQRPYHSALLYQIGQDFAAVQRFRRAAPNSAPPAVLVTPREAAVVRFDALSAGFAALLELPFDKRQLFNVLHSVAAVDDPRDGVVRLQDYARPARAPRKLRVLVADDNPTNREVIRRILERGGHGTTVVDDGEQVLHAMERERFDVVLLDRNMPGLSGIEVLQAIRVMTGGGARLPVAILSADVTPEAKREALEAGADAFLPKPIEFSRLLRELDTLASAREEPVRSEGAPPRATPESCSVINVETLRLLEELGSSPEFMENLAEVFIADTTRLLERIEVAVASRNCGELRSLVHAMKGSAVSMGAERLTRACAAFGDLTDSELRLQAPSLFRALSEAFAACRVQLGLYLRDKKTSAG